MTMPSGPSATAPAGSGNDYRVTRGVLIIVGAIAAFLGLFIMLGPEDSSIGIGGEVSWEVGQIAPAWGYGLLIAGAVLLAAGAVLVARARRMPKGGSEKADGWHDLLAHTAVFLLVNAFVWAQDIAIGGGVDYAYWITVPWAIGLVAHAVAQASANRQGQA